MLFPRPTHPELNGLRKPLHDSGMPRIEELGNQEKTVSTLAEDTDLPGTRVSQHLSLLRAHRVVEERPEGRHRLYHLTQPELAAWIISGLDFIEGRVALFLRLLHHGFHGMAKGHARRPTANHGDR